MNFFKFIAIGIIILFPWEITNSQIIDTIRVTPKGFSEIIIFQLPDFYYQCEDGPSLLDCNIEKQNLIKWLNKNKEVNYEGLDFTKKDFSRLVSNFEKYLKNKFKKNSRIEVEKPCLYLTKSIINNMNYALYDIIRKYIKYAIENNEINISYTHNFEPISHIIRVTEIFNNDTLKHPGTGERIKVGTKKVVKYYVPDISKEICTSVNFTPNENSFKIDIDIKDAKFQGGERELMKYLRSNLKEINSKGKVMVGFLVTEEGQIQNVRIINGLDEETNKKIIQIIKNMPDWSPKTINGNKVESQIVLPINLN